MTFTHIDVSPDADMNLTLYTIKPCFACGGDVCDTFKPIAGRPSEFRNTGLVRRRRPSVDCESCEGKVDLARKRHMEEKGVENVAFYFISPDAVADGFLVVDDKEVVSYLRRKMDGDQSPLDTVLVTASG